MLVELVFWPLTLCAAPSGSDKQIRLFVEVSRVHFLFIFSRFLSERGAPDTLPPVKLHQKLMVQFSDAMPAKIHPKIIRISALR